MARALAPERRMARALAPERRMARPMYVIPFGVDPETIGKKTLSPHGTFNFSGTRSTWLIFTLTRKQPTDVRVYARNFNSFVVKGGMGACNFGCW